MSIFDFLRGEFIDVIHWTDDTRDTIVWRFEREGHAIKYGAKLTVREGQAAVFVHEGQLADVFGPGLYELETNNLPILTTLQHWDHGFQSPFKSEIYFVNTRRFTDLKWGTRNPITCRDPEFGMVRLRAFGTYTMRVTDPGKFLVEIVGTDGEFTTDEIEFQIRNHHRLELQPDHRLLRHPGARHGGEHHRPREDRARADRPDDRRVRPRAARLLHREHLAARGGREGARQAHLDLDRRRPLEIHRLQRRRGDDQVGREPRRRAAAWPPAWAWAWAWRWPTAWPAAAPGARRRPPPSPTPPPPPGARSAGTWRRTARPPAPSPATSSGAWPARARSAPTPGSGPRAGRTGSAAATSSELADLFSAPPPPPPAG